MLVNPQAPGADSQFEEAQTAARILSQEIVVVKASSETDLDAAFAILSHVGAEALLVAADPFFNSRREQLIALAARYIIPAIYEFREAAAASPYRKNPKNGGLVLGRERGRRWAGFCRLV